MKTQNTSSAETQKDKTVSIDPETHQKLRMEAARTGKKIKTVIQELTDTLESEENDATKRQQKK